MKELFKWIGFGLLMTVFLSCESEKSKITLEPTGIRIQLTLNGPIYQGTFYSGYLPRTDYAIWIEDQNRQYVKTLRITRSVVSVGDYSHVDHLPTWVSKSGITYDKLLEETGNQPGVAPSFEGVTSASPYFPSEDSTQTFVVEWDFTDSHGNAVSPGTYYFCAETANITKNEASSYTIQAETTSGSIDLKKNQIIPASPTAHIRELTGEFVVEKALSKSGWGITEPK